MKFPFFNSAAPLLIACMIWLASCAAAFAATPQCAKLAEVLAGLATNYKEATIWSGVLPNGQMLSITATADRSTWTALAVQPDGMACLLSSGPSWVEGEMSLPPAGQEG